VAHVLHQTTGKAARVLTGFAYVPRKMSGLLGCAPGYAQTVVTRHRLGFCITVITDYPSSERRLATPCDKCAFTVPLLTPVVPAISLNRYSFSLYSAA